MEIKACYEVKLRRKTMSFASNQHITCFILSRNLMQITRWLASDCSIGW